MSKPAHNRIDITGKRFDRLLVLGYHDTVTYGNQGKKTARWKCECDCGNIVVVPRYRIGLNKGGTKSCGCLRKEHIAAIGRAQLGKKTAGPGVSNRNSHLRNYVNTCKLKNRAFNLTEEEFDHLISQNCHYCNQEINKIYKDGKLWDIKWNGIDRVDSSKGYDLDNVVPCCKTCNNMKMALSYDEFLRKIEDIYNFLKIGSKSD